MAKQKRKSAKGKPVTAHPLFPAVVALWFGSLFGLGSLAIRPSLLENVVVKTGIDLVVPAAGPPLGVTARILLALVLAAVGATIGAIIGRWIARPKPVVRQRRRNAGAVEADDDVVAAPYNDNPVFAAAAEAGGDAGILAGRRRALAIEPDDDDFVPHDPAPLPGGTPQVFDIAGLQLGGLESAASPDDCPEPLDLGSFTDAPGVSSPVELDWETAQPPVAHHQASVAAAQEHMAGRQVFAPAPTAVDPGVGYDAVGAAPEARQIFGQTGAAATADLSAAPPRQIFGVSVEDDHVSQDFVKQAGFKTSVFEVEPAAPLFPARLPVESIERPPLAALPNGEAATQVATVPATAVGEGQLAPIDAGAAETIQPADADIGTLGMTDLAHRLAQSMERRRAARAAATATAAAAEAESSPAAVTPIPQLPNAADGIGALAGAELLSSVPAPFAAALPEPRLPDEQTADFAMASTETLLESPTCDQGSATVAEPEAAVFPPRFDTQAPDFSAAFSVPVESDAHVATAPLAMPAALRPLDFDHSTGEDFGLDSLLPPRRISMPTMPSAAGFHASELDRETADAIAAEALEPEEDPASIDVAFGSLVDLGATMRPSFVRIAEPDGPVNAVEPVVIFPGQAPAAPSLAVPATPVSAESAQFRRFDAPATAGQGQPVEVSGLESALDPAEAEQSLRLALANLQRMSGAA